MNKQLKVCVLTPEAVPFAKTGGLADVAGSLPGALKILGVDVRIIVPFYRAVREKEISSSVVIKDLEVPFGDSFLTADILETVNKDNVPVYLIDREDMYDRPGLYGVSQGDYYDNLERFAFFSRAALSIIESLGESPDIIHCHDWQTGLIPALLNRTYSETSFFSDTSSVFTIHNIGYQGIFPKDKFTLTGLSEKEFYHPSGIEYWGSISLLKSGIVYSDSVTTVSPRYAEEIKTPDYGMGMEGILEDRSADLYGILNGIDYKVWDPSSDKNLIKPYSEKNLKGKHSCKEYLIKEMGLDNALINAPVMGIVSRLDTQKGIDILLEALDELMNMKVGIVILGSGKEDIEKAVKTSEKRYPGRLAARIGYDDPLAHRIIAGSDMFIIPSRYEPCGLTQMYALKYGTAPVVRSTGGLDDTIVSFDPVTEKGNGFKFESPDAASLVKSVREALEVYKKKSLWKKLITTGMKEDFSWERSARRYLKIYESTAKRRRAHGVFSLGH